MFSNEEFGQLSVIVKDNKVIGDGSPEASANNTYYYTYFQLLNQLIAVYFSIKQIASRKKIGGFDCHL